MSAIHLRGGDVLRWAPRVLCILFAAFISIFALDAFNEGQHFWETAAAVIIHLIPTLIVIGVLLVAWRWQATGGVLLIVLATWYLLEASGRFPPATIAVISGPLLVAGGLFLVDWGYQSRKPRET